MAWEFTPQEVSGFVEKDPASLYGAFVQHGNYAPRRKMVHNQRRNDVIGDYRAQQTRDLMGTGRLPQRGFLDFLSNYDWGRDYQDYARLFSPTGRKGYTAPPVVRTY